MVRALIIKGYGINCENEMGEACRIAGAEPVYSHINELLTNELSLSSFKLLMLPGGFSFGDELGAGKVFANRLSYASQIKREMQKFVDDGGCILGVCNGFQLLVKLGLLPSGSEQQATLAPNDSMKFENRWAHHAVCPSSCVFTKGLETLYLPVRHGEGKLVLRSPSLLNQLIDNGQVPLRYADEGGQPTQEYPQNPNGSPDAVAALCDPTGRILGMMAHPEAFTDILQHPNWTRRKEIAAREKKPFDRTCDGLKLFQNVINYLEDQ